MTGITRQRSARCVALTDVVFVGVARSGSGPVERRAPRDSHLTPPANSPGELHRPHRQIALFGARQTRRPTAAA